MMLMIDGSCIKCKEDFYQIIKKELNAPAYFGNNLDALYDILTEQPDLLQIKFIHYDRMCQHLGNSFCQKVLKILQDADIFTVIDQH